MSGLQRLLYVPTNSKCIIIVDWIPEPWVQFWNLDWIPKNHWNFLDLSFSDQKIMNLGFGKMRHPHAKEWKWTLILHYIQKLMKIAQNGLKTLAVTV